MTEQMMVLSFAAAPVVEVGEVVTLIAQPLRDCSVVRVLVPANVAPFYVLESLDIGSQLLIGEAPAEVFSFGAGRLPVEANVRARTSITVKARCVGLRRPRLAWRAVLTRWGWSVVKRWWEDRKLWRAWLRAGKVVPAFRCAMCVRAYSGGDDALERARNAWKDWTDDEAEREVAPWNEDDEDE